MSSAIVAAVSSDLGGLTSDGASGTASVSVSLASTATVQASNSITATSDTAAVVSSSKAASLSQALSTLSVDSSASQASILSAASTQSAASVASRSVGGTTSTTPAAAAAVAPVATSTGEGSSAQTVTSAPAKSGVRMTSVLITSTATVNGHLTTFQTLVPTALSPFTTNSDPPLSHKAIAGTVVGTLVATAVLSMIGFLFWRRMSMQKRERNQQRNMTSRWGPKEPRARRVLDDEVDDDVPGNPGAGSTGHSSIYAATTEDSHRTGASGVSRARTIEKPYEYGAVGSGWAKRTMSTYSANNNFYGDNQEATPSLPFDANHLPTAYSYPSPPDSATAFMEKDITAIRDLRAKRTGSGSGSIFREDFGDAEKGSMASGSMPKVRTYDPPQNRWGGGGGEPQVMPSPASNVGNDLAFYKQSSPSSPPEGYSSVPPRPWNEEVVSTVSSSMGLLAGGGSFVGGGDSGEALHQMPNRRRRTTSYASDSSASEAAYGGMMSERSRSPTSIHQYPPDTTSNNPPTLATTPIAPLQDTPAPPSAYRNMSSPVTPSRRRSTSPKKGFSSPPPIPARNPRRMSSGGSVIVTSPTSIHSPTSPLTPAPPPPGAAPSLGPMANAAERVDEQFQIHADTAQSVRSRQSFGNVTTRSRRSSYVLPEVPVKGDGSLRDEDSPPPPNGRRRRGSLASYLSAEESS
ncbi:hypothetical protein FRB93_005040 [Tulasnella sp. JGI-2019a]|nr:hypothetical protein FRB93_005040 [Tulasnella sp. JGI-2019a]